MTTEISDVQGTDHDRVYLGHLYVVRTANAAYYNNRFLGRGGNGTAFLVTCSEGECAGLQMVLKVFHRVSDDSRRDAFLREINRLRGLQHEAVVQVFDDGVYTNNGLSYPFMLMEFLPKTVRQLLVTQQVDRLQAIRIALNCSSALRYIHGRDRQIVHRDIKPENILLSESGAKLADFGLAKELEELVPIESSVVDTSELDVQGTAGERPEVDAPSAMEVPTQFPGMPRWYRSPEMIAHAHDRSVPLTPASDIYQLGTVFYELLTGFNPQLPSNSIYDPIRLDLRTIQGEHGQDLLDVIETMLRDDPSERPDALQCVEKLNEIHRRFCASMKRVTGDFY